MKIKENKGRVSTIELVAIVFLSVAAIFLGFKGLNWYYDSLTNGNDSLMANTAESVARVNSLNGLQCPVGDCPHGDKCTHLKGSYYVGYFDSVGNKIVANPTEGYNQAETMKIGKNKYYGEIGTMVIEIKCKEGTVELNWVLGK